MRLRSFALLLTLLAGACSFDGGSGPEQPPPDAGSPVDSTPATGSDAPPAPPPDLCKTANGGCDPAATCTQIGDQVACACPDGYQGDGASCAKLAVCAAPLPAPGDVGDLCTPMAAFLVAPSTTCAQKLCAQDGLGDGGGYCTATCDPATADACPSGFACAETGAGQGLGLPSTICERVEQLASASCVAWPSDATPASYLPPWYATLADGTQVMGVEYGQNAFFYTRSPGSDTWDGGAPAVGTTTIGGEMATSGVALEDHGFVSPCHGGLCYSPDGLTRSTLQLPAGEEIDALASNAMPRFAGTSSRFFVLTQAGALLRCDTTACTREPMPDAYLPSSSGTLWQEEGFVRSGKDTFVRLGSIVDGSEHTSTLRLDGDCWKPVVAPERASATWGGPDGQIHYAQGQALCEAPVE